MSRNSDLRHLEGDIAAVADDLGADLDELLPQAGQRPVLDRLRCCQGAQEVAEIIGEGLQLAAGLFSCHVAWARGPTPDPGNPQNGNLPPSSDSQLSRGESIQEIIMRPAP